MHMAERTSKHDAASVATAPEHDRSDSERPEAPEKKPRAAHHCKRFWWVYLVALVLIAVLVVPLVIFVAVPKIAQGKINATTLSVEGIRVTQAQPQAMRMAINSTIRSDGKVKARISGFQGTLYLADVEPALAFARIDFPATTNQDVMVVNITQDVVIEDVDAFTTFNQHLLSQSEVQMRVVGRPTIRVAGIPRSYPILFSKDVTLVGMSSFAGIAVTNPKINIGALTNNFNATATIPNPSVFSLEVGNAVFSTSVNGLNFGTAYINNMNLVPGANKLFISADSQQVTALQILGQKPYCNPGQGTVNIELLARSVKNRAGQEIAWMSGALARTKQIAPVKIGAAVEQALGTAIPCMGL